MVCKEDVILWFKDLDGYKRIDVMYELISMCVPFEIRILGSYVEEIGKTSFQELRGSALTANDLDKLTKDSSLTHGLMEEVVRHRAIIYLSLLSGGNWKCANWFYKTILRTDWVESCVLKRNFKDDNLLSELLLLFTIGLHHPAFSFEQKMYFGDLLEQLIKQKDSKKCLPCKPFSNGPPPLVCTNSVPKIIPDVQTSMKIPPNEVESPVQPTHIFTNSVNGPIDVLPQSVWTRPGFVGTIISGAPEVAPFPPPLVSPLVSQPTSPTRSRATSPHKTHVSRAISQSTHLVDHLPAVPLDPLATSGVHSLSDLKTNDELNHIADDKLRDTPWLNSVTTRKDAKPPNGIRLPPYSKAPPQQYFLEQIQALNLEGANSLHCSSSSSSSDNSINQSPPDTPSTTPVVPNHGPGRGESKTRINGIPQFVNTGPPISDTTPPLNNCSVPYPSFPPVALTAVPPNRSVYPYGQSYRMPFTSPFNYQHPEVFSYNNCSYMPYIFSSTPSQVPARTANCFNCGATGHNGSDCTGQTIEDITKKAYSIDYNSTLPDADK